MATNVQQLPFSNYTLTDFKAWGQGPGTALAAFGWTKDANVLGAVNWSTIVNKPGDVPGVLPAQGQTVFRGAYSTAAVSYNSNDIVTYNGASWICISAFTSSVSIAYPGNDYGGGTQHWQLYPYEVWQSAVSPTIYLKFEYHTNGSVQQLPAMRVTVGTSDSDVFTLTQVATSSGGVAVYTGTITGGSGNNFSGQTFVVAGFTNSNNNGTFTCSASSTTTLTLSNAAAAAETHAATATSYSGNLGNGTGNQATNANYLMSTNPGASYIANGLNYPCYFSGDSGNRFAMLMWEPFPSLEQTPLASSFFCIERSLSNVGAYYTTPSGAVTPYWVIGWAGYSGSDNYPMQAFVNTTGSTWVKTTEDNQWWMVAAHQSHTVQIESGGSTATGWATSIGSQSMPIFPLIPLVGWAGNPSTVAASVKQADGPWGTLTVQMYGSTRTFFVSHNSVYSGIGGSTNNWLCMRFD
jgi:hypothetical protein